METSDTRDQGDFDHHALLHHQVVPSSPPSPPPHHHPPTSPLNPPPPPPSECLEGLQALPPFLQGPVGQALGCLHTCLGSSFPQVPK